jgi:cellobiose phosphorylase
MTPMSRALGRPQRRPDRVATLRSPSGLEVELTPAGDVRAIRAPGDLLVNQYVPGPHDAATGGLHLRRRTPDGVVSVPLIGARSDAAHRTGDGVARWDGAGLGARWTVHLVLDPERTAWVWRVDLAPVPGEVPAGAAYDVAVLQDLSLAPEAAAQSSEPYVSQYVAHRLERDVRFGRVVLSRQTMTSAPALPLALSALVEGAVAAGTDAFDLVTPHARSGRVPAFLTGEPWPDRVRQHEMATAGLLSGSTDLAAPWTLHAVARFWPDVPGEMTGVLADLPALADHLVARASVVAGATTPARPGTDERSLLATALVLAGDPLTDEALLALGDGARYPERDASGALLSSFTGTGAHVVRGEKDLLLDRPHGHVLLCGDALAPDRPTLSTTVFAHGVVGSHTVLGNTSFDRFAGVHRNHLNLLRSNGVRVLVRRDGRWQLLGQPSAFVLDVGEARWLYRWADAEIEVRTVAAADRAVLLTEVRSSVDVDVLVTTDVDLGAGAWHAEPAEAPCPALAFRADPGTTVAAHHDALTYALAASPGAELGGDAPLFAEGDDRGTSVVTVRAAATRLLRVAVAADLAHGEQAAPDAAAAVADGQDRVAHAAAPRRTLAALTRDIRIAESSRLAELSVLLPWWAHDARVHFLVPHGLEQYSGAAWGTRDVCQGPFELLVAAGQFDAARDVLLRVLSRQSVDGTFPQWFMFDDYAEVLQEHAHGDVVVWPLFALGQYLRATGDLAVLDAVVPFRDGDGATVLAHLEAIVEHQATHRVPGTALPAYGEGDWDDTLQPARPEMREHMTSTWTSALTFQALTLVAEQLHDAPGAPARALGGRTATMAGELLADVRRHLLPDGVATGFATVSGGVVTPVIHPRDTTTGLTYRLIAMTRPIIAELFDADQADRHEQLVREHLHFPDGVRLTDKPARFADGQVESFLRAEQAAFFGREVGLMYVHAHVRWVEALASLGRAAVGDELLRLSPIGMRERVPSALPRQRTCYTSSSDATFPDRYTAAAGFEALRTGDVPTADGWRVYSSGPGIYIRQVLHGLLGLEERADVLVVDPALAAEDDGLEVDLVLAGRNRRVRYRVDPEATRVEVAADGAALPARELPRRYRPAAVALPLPLLRDAAVLEIRTPPGSAATTGGPTA